MNSNNWFGGLNGKDSIAFISYKWVATDIVEISFKFEIFIHFTNSIGKQVCTT
jgi:hypothetical protein